MCVSRQDVWARLSVQAVNVCSLTQQCPISDNYSYVCVI